MNKLFKSIILFTKHIIISNFLNIIIGETAVAFEVVDDSLIKKHPPKKFQKLEDMQENLTLTPEELEKKQEIARKRRENLLSKRVQSAKERSAKSAHIRSNTDENDEDINDAIESPEDM
ncbi:UNVERIFIED_CONTAM: hypothetical protein RMT77_012273 [Armadillidium vulgare]